MRKGRLDEAARQFRHILLLDPNDIDARYELSVILTKQGKIDQAVQEFRRVLDLDPGHKEARRCLQDLTKKQNPPR